MKKNQILPLCLTLIALTVSLAPASPAKGKAPAAKQQKNLAVEDAIVKAAQLRLSNQPKKALEILMAQEKKAAHHAGYFSERGRVYLDLEQTDKATTDLNKAIQLNPNLFDAWDRRAYCFVVKKDWPRAIEDYTKAIKINPTSLKTYMNRATAYRESGKHKLAQDDIDKYNKLLDKSTKASDHEAYNRVKYMEKNDGVKTAIDFLKGEILSHGTFSNYMQLGRLYRQTKQNAKALETFNKAILEARKPDHLPSNLSSALGMRALAYLDNKKYDKAIADFSEVINIAQQKQKISTQEALLKRQSAFAYQMRAKAYLAQGNAVKALEDAEVLVKLEPEAGNSYVVRAEVLKANKKLAQAQKDEAKAKTLAPTKDQDKTPYD
jgi:tetratricopeptide (TPR) repeat protein